MVDTPHHDSTGQDTSLSADGSPADANLRDERADLVGALRDLSRMTVGGSTLEASLTHVAELAVHAIPGAEGAGLTMNEDGHPQTICASTEFVRAVDEAQYGLDEGPCITAAAEGRTVISGDLGADAAWPRFGREARRLGVHSALSLPLLHDDEPLGALNVYARPVGVFDDHAAALGEAFAVAAAVAVHNARQLMQAQRLAEQLQTALVSRAAIDQAIGILMSRQGGTSEDAFARLRQMSQSQNVKLVKVAESVIEEAVRRARARHAGS